MAAIEPKPLTTSNRPSRFNLTYAFELVALDGAGSLSVSQGGANRVVNLPINPHTYNVTMNAAAAVTPTAGGVAIEEDGFILRDVVVEGTCGLKTKRGWSAGTAQSPGGLITADGNTLWRELRNLFLLYDQFRKDPAKAPARYLMAWHDFRLDDHWIVVPKAHSMARSAEQYRLHLPYSISLTAVADYDKIKKNFFDDGLFGDIKGIFAKIRAVIATIQGLVEDARAFVTGVKSFIEETVIGTINAVTSLINAAQDFKQAVKDFIDLPRRIAAAIRGLVDAWHELMGDSSNWSPTSQRESEILAQLEIAGKLGDCLDAMLAVADVWRPSWKDVAEDRAELRRGERRLSSAEVAAAVTAAQATPATRSLTARATPGSPLRREADQPGPEDVSGPVYTAQRAYTVRFGDTVLGIAVREMGNPDAWVDIVDANGLRPPYISPLGLPGTVQIGGTLMLPTTGAQQDTIPSLGPALNEAADEAILGIDFYLTPDGEFEIDPASGGTDVREVRGIACYEQALDVRFRTQLGTNLVAPGVGILTPIGQQNGQGVPQAVALSVRSAALQDPRTVAVEGLKVADDGDTVAVELTTFAQGARGGRVVRRVLE